MEAYFKYQYSILIYEVILIYGMSKHGSQPNVEQCHFLILFIELKLLVGLYVWWLYLYWPLWMKDRQ